jgi:hypothetical protein
MGEWKYAPPFLTSALDVADWSASRFCRVIPEATAPGFYDTEDFVGPRGGLNPMKKRKICPPPRESNHDRPVRSPPLHRLIYPGSKMFVIVKSNKFKMDNTEWNKFVV